jgi:hypothetical protein
MPTSFLPPPTTPTKPTLTANQARANDIMVSASKDTQAFFMNWRGDVLRFLDGGMKTTPATVTAPETTALDLPTLQQFLTDWQTLAPGAPAQFLAHSQAAVAFFESLWPGITVPVLANVPALTANADGSVTVNPVA